MQEETFIEWTRNKYRRYRSIHGTDIDTVFSYLKDLGIEGRLWRLVGMYDLTDGERFLVRQLILVYKGCQNAETKKEKIILEKLTKENIEKYEIHTWDYFL